MANDFYPGNFHISHIPFLRFLEGKKEPERVKGVLFYVHHDQHLDKVNAKLAAKGCRAATKEDLQLFFRMQEGILVQLSFYCILATDPQSVEREDSAKESTLFGIVSSEDKNVQIRKVKFDLDILPGHLPIYVLGVMS